MADPPESTTDTSFFEPELRLIHPKSILEIEIRLNCIARMLQFERVWMALKSILQYHLKIFCKLFQKYSKHFYYIRQPKPKSRLQARLSKKFPTLVFH